MSADRKAVDLSDIAAKRQEYNEKNPDIWKFFINPVMAKRWDKSQAKSADEKKEPEISKDQEEWGRMCDDAAKSILEKFEMPTPEYLYDSDEDDDWLNPTYTYPFLKRMENLIDCYFRIFTPERRKIAEAKKHLPQYGIPGVHVDNETGIVTGYNATFMREVIFPVPGRNYSEYFSFFKEQIRKLSLLENNDFTTSIVHSGVHDGIPYTVTEVGVYGTVKNPDGSERRTLYSINCLVEAETDLPYKVIVKDKTTNESKIYTNPGTKEFIIPGHLRRVDTGAALLFADQYWKKALHWKKNGDNENELFWNIGQLMWHLAHAMPAWLGSAATTEIMTSFLLQLHHITPLRLKHEVAWDFLAFITPNPNDFAEVFCKTYSVSAPEMKASQQDKPKERSAPKTIELSELPRTDNLIDTIEFPCTPLLMNDHIPFEERLPNKWRTRFECMNITWMGRSSFHQYLTEQASYFNNPYLRALDTARINNEKRRLLNAENINAFVVTCYGDYFSALDRDLSVLVKFVENSSVEQLAAVVNQHKRSQKLFDWIDSLSYENQLIFTSVIKHSQPYSGILDLRDILDLEFLKDTLKLSNEQPGETKKAEAKSETKSDSTTGKEKTASKIRICQIILKVIQPSFSDNSFTLFMPKKQKSEKIISAMMRALTNNKDLKEVDYEKFISTRYSNQPSIKEALEIERGFTKSQNYEQVLAEIKKMMAPKQQRHPS